MRKCVGGSDENECWMRNPARQTLLRAQFSWSQHIKNLFENFRFAPATASLSLFTVFLGCLLHKSRSGKTLVKTFKLKKFLFCVSDVENSVHSRSVPYSFCRQSRGESQDCFRLFEAEQGERAKKAKKKSSKKLTELRYFAFSERLHENWSIHDKLLGQVFFSIHDPSSHSSLRLRKRFSYQTKFFKLLSQIKI